jgi:hypothetical protein
LGLSPDIEFLTGIREDSHQENQKIVLTDDSRIQNQEWKKKRTALYAKSFSEIYEFKTKFF